MSQVITYEFRKLIIEKCNFCQIEYTRYQNELVKVPVFSTKDGKHCICAICIKIMGSQLK